MEASSYLLPGPPFKLTPSTSDAFEDLWHATPTGGCIDYCLPYPKWQFLSYLCERKELVLHGSQEKALAVVEPRRARDQRDFSSQQAIYATTDGIWVMYFAILDRRRFPWMTLFNSCLQVRDAENQLSEPLYFFSITHQALLQAPWCEGTIYILPRQPFEQELPQQKDGIEIILPHWISRVSVAPCARIDVVPQDFPFLAQVHGHDNNKLLDLFQADPGGFPWPAALES